MKINLIWKLHPTKTDVTKYCLMCGNATCGTIRFWSPCEKTNRPWGAGAEILDVTHERRYEGIVYEISTTDTTSSPSRASIPIDSAFDWIKDCVETAARWFFEKCFRDADVVIDDSQLKAYVEALMDNE